MSVVFIEKDGLREELLTIEFGHAYKARFHVFKTASRSFTAKDDFRLFYFCTNCFKQLERSSACYHKILKIFRDNKEVRCQSCCRLGCRNGFKGKTHSSETIDKIRDSTRNTSRLQWENEEYRAKVIKGISKPRRESFKKEQSDRVSQWYKDNPEQRLFRSTSMRRTWSEGSLHSDVSRVRINHSKGEKALFEYLRLSFPELTVNDKVTIRSRDNKRWLFPDIVVGNHVVVEYNGDYWHANPSKYKENDVAGHKSTAGEIWERDKKRIGELLKLGYEVVIVWSSDKYKENGLIEKIRNKIPTTS
jgi:G:T-mismatch repair DNA endonuclease (very short patch repair protein)